MLNINQINTISQANLKKYKTEVENFWEITHEFLNDCTDFVYNVNNLEHSPWKNKEIRSWVKKELNFHLGQGQYKVLQFLQYRYFQKNRPCFVKQIHIANVLQMGLSQVNRTLKSLEKKGLILRVQWLYKGKRKRALILPLLPSIQPIFKDKNLPKIDFQRCHIKYNTLFCKPLKSERFSKAYIIYTNIIYTNILFNLNKVNIKHINKNIKCSYEHSVGLKTKPTERKLKIIESKSNPIKINNIEPKTKIIKNKSNIIELNSFEKKGGKVLDRFLIERKKREGKSSYTPIFNKLRLKLNYNFDKLPINEQNNLNTYYEHFFGLNLRTHFKIRKNASVNDIYAQHALGLRYRFLKLAANGHNLQWGLSDKIIKHWNMAQIKSKKRQKLNLNRLDTKAYKNAVIAITYALVFDANKNISTIYKAIDRLVEAEHNNKPPFTWRNQITIDKFFAPFKSNKPFLPYYLGSNIEFKRWLFSYKVSLRHKERVDVGYKKFVKMYIDQFYYNKREKGENVCYQFESMIQRWLDDRIKEIVDIRGTKMYRQMNGYSLIENRNGDGILKPPVLLRFFDYYYRRNQIVLMKDLLNKDTWKDFIHVYMRIEVGLKDFYKEMRRDK